MTSIDLTERRADRRRKSPRGVCGPAVLWSRSKSAFRLAAAFFGIAFGSPAASVAQPATAAPPAADQALRGAPATTDATANKPDAEPAELGREWVRVAKDEAGEPKAMQVAIVTYKGIVPIEKAAGNAAGNPVTVDLIGAVHVGDAEYYQQLNQRFRQYEALLYELVAPEGTVVQPGRATSSPLGALQGGMKSMLELEHQLDKIDYRQPNFVHADMSPEEFFQSMEDRGEGVVQTFFRMMGQGIATQSKQTARGESTDVDLMRALFAPDRARRLRIVFAKQMTDLESAMGGLSSGKGSTLVTERNKSALKVLRREINSGRSRLGVFYGAAHMGDMDKRLRGDFNLTPEAIVWLDAWDLSAK